MLSYGTLRPLLHLFSPEAAHAIALWGLKNGFVERMPAADDAVLATRVGIARVTQRGQPVLDVPDWLT